MQLDGLHSFYRATLCVSGVAVGPVSVRPSVRHSHALYQTAKSY